MSKAWPVAGIDPDATLAANARVILAVRVAEFYSYAPIVAREDAIEELHALRIAAKRLRYTLELFRDVFATPGERLIDHVKAMQEELGEIHDHDVRLDLIAAELTALDPAARPGPDGPGDPRPGLGALKTRETAARLAHYRAFLTLWDDHAAAMRTGLVALSALPLPPAARSS